MNTMTASVPRQGHDVFTISGYGHTYELTEAEFNAAMMAADALAPHARPLTTGEAAVLLGVSGKTVARLLDAGKIPFYRNGENGHRMVRLCDVIAYRQQRERRHTMLERSRDLAVSMGGYEDPTSLDGEDVTQ